MTSTAVAPSEVGVQVGDFFVSSWGYDQTNIDFYKVVGLTPKGVKIQAWSSATVDSSGSQEAVVPGEGPATWVDWSACTEGMDYWERKEAQVIRDAPVQTKRLGGSAEYPSVKVRSFAWAYKWNGGVSYQTAAGYGH